MRLAGTSGERMASVVGVAPSATGAQICTNPGVVSTRVEGSGVHTPPPYRWIVTAGSAKPWPRTSMQTAGGVANVAVVRTS